MEDGVFRQAVDEKILVAGGEANLHARQHGQIQRSPGFGGQPVTGEERVPCSGILKLAGQKMVRDHDGTVSGLQAQADHLLGGHLAAGAHLAGVQVGFEFDEIIHRIAPIRVDRRR